MEAAKQLFRKYLFSSILILLLFFITNVILLFGILLILKKDAKDLIPISQIADYLKVDKQHVYADDEVYILLNEKNAWAMLLDNNGAVIWEAFMPELLPRQYTAPDIARFSRWYLDEYPVLVHSLSTGLLVIAYPPNSLTKLNYITNEKNISAIILDGAFLVVINLLLVLLLFWHNTRRVEKAVVPILHGIISLTKGMPVTLSETKELAAINLELSRAGQYLLKKDKARGDWINGVSHDVRTPLSIMLGYAGEIEDSQTLPQSTREKAGIIRRQGEKLRQLITDLNLTSRLEYSMQPLNLETLYPVELARQVISEFLNSGMDEKYQISFDTAPALNAVTMQGDSSLITRMLSNLIQNSISHNTHGCQIIVTVHKAAKGFKYLVTDDGTGLTEKQLEQFNTGTFAEPYYKSNDEAAHGFGLYLVQQIVKAHGGYITYKNILTGGLSVEVVFL